MEKSKNNSGQGRLARLPKELEGFNWGAFYLTPVWAIAHKCHGYATIYIAAGIIAILAMLIGFFAIMHTSNGRLDIFLSKLQFFILYTGIILVIILLPVSIKAGFEGNRLAWENIRWKSIEDFKKTQKNWAMTGTVIFSTNFLQLARKLFFKI